MLDTRRPGHKREHKYRVKLVVMDWSWVGTEEEGGGDHERGEQVGGHKLKAGRP